MIEQLHFLRPLWLFAVPAIAGVWWLLRSRQNPEQPFGNLVAPHLRSALTIQHNTRTRVSALDSFALALLLLALAAAGPAWRQQVAPWFEETAPLVIAMEVTDSMRSNDLTPSRLERARFKALDLVAARTGARTALIAYAGSAHIVVPPTTDGAILAGFLESLDPAIMPRDGTNSAAALPLALGLLGENAQIGTLLFIGDGFDSADIPALASFTADPAAPAVAALIMGTDAGGVALLPDGKPVLGPGGGALQTAIDGDLLARVSRETGLTVVRSEPGDGDIRRLLRLVESNLLQADDPDAEWHDEGWLLLWPALLLVLYGFRRGWVLR
ncbi:MAG TPA: VWA domain-containing protein [Haliea salexigens]|uniref:VWA domain-containing protein n=1 Tax=Haliea salexigens TaxID=287487 RepID=A0A3C1KT11_9GAMM|nr:VWA domain-containing protein [Haliea salexigens]HAN29643.1 VWA domain-containing protein [Haliea salexigens]